MKMEYSKQRADSSSDESDIPPTPAAKSTPLTTSNRQRQQSSSDSSSSLKSRPSAFTPKSAAYDDSSSEDDEGTPKAAPRISQVNIKTEPRDSSSDDDMFKTQSNVTSLHQMNRSTHAMSSSDSEDSDQEQTMVGNQPNQGSDSSEDSDSDHVTRPPAFNTLAKVTKVEKPSTTESSNESDAEEVSENIPALAYAPNDSSSEDEGISSNQAQREVDTSSDKSEEKQGKKGILTATHSAAQNSSSEESDEEEESNTIHPAKDTSSDGSDDEVVERKPIVSEKDADTSTDSSSEDESDNNSKPPLPLQNKKTSKTNYEVSEDESSDEEQPSKPPPSISRGHPTNEQSSDESSEDEENERHIQQPPKATPAVAHKKVTTHSASEDSSDASDSENDGLQKSASQDRGAQAGSDSSEDEETYVSKMHPKSQPKVTASPIHQSSDLMPKNQQQAALASGKHGKSLLKEAFKERDRFRMESALLSVEDIGSDDEIWLLQCPTSMDVSALKKQSINLASDGDIQLEDGPTYKRFSIAPEHNSNLSINCVLPHQNSKGFQISSLPIRGKVVIQEYVHVPKLRLPEKSAKGPVPFPNGLKVRHPLLGVEFKEHIAQAQRALRANGRYERNKNKKRKHSSEDVYPAEANGEDSSLSHSTAPVTPLQSTQKKDKKLKNICHENQNNGVEKEGSSKKKKKKLSEEENLNNERLENQSFDGSYLNDTYRKKNKKSKMDTSNHSFDRGNYNQEIGMKVHKTKIKPEPCDTSDDNLPRKKSKKSKRGEAAMDVDLGHTSNASKKTLDSDQTPVSSHMEDSSHKKKSRKSKENNVFLDPSKIKQEHDFVNGTSEPYSSEFSFSKKNKRKHPEDSSSNVLETPSKKKKKHSF